jgi:hypothetical protein
LLAKRFSVDVSPVPNISPERYIFPFQLPHNWLAEREIEPQKV